MLLIYLWCNISVPLLFILLTLNHIEYLNEWVFISGFKRVELLISRDLVLLLTNTHGGIIARVSILHTREFTVSVSANLAEEFFVFQVFSHFSFCLCTLPWLSDELKHDEEDKELNEDDC